MKPALSLVKSPRDSTPPSTPARAEVVTHQSPCRSDKTWRWAAATKSEIETTVATAREILPKWRAVCASDRLKVLRHFGETLQSHRDELVDFLVEDIGKPIRYARGELARALALIDAAGQQIDPDQDSIPTKTGYRREPIGVIALIAPFNNPLAIPIGKIVPALLYGNSVIWKPAIPGTHIALRTAELFEEATKHSDLLQVLSGGEQTARRVMEACDAVTLSGSLNAGQVAHEICAARYIPLQAELGGNNASIVWRDADLALAAASIAEGAFAFSGQRCTANRRAIVDQKIYDRFLDELVAASGRLVLGRPQDEQTQIGPLISSAARQRVAGVIDHAKESRLRVIRPLKSESRKGNAWLVPAIVCCDDPAHEIVQEETFGPVLVVQRAKDWDDAILLCNNVKQGLAGAVFSKSQTLIEDFLRRAKAGILKINSSTADAAVDLPFGGWKASGVGPAEHGPANREFFARMQAIYFS